MRVWLQGNGWRVLEHKSLAGPASLIVAETLRQHNSRRERGKQLPKR